jgi:hypothetical protein
MGKDDLLHHVAHIRSEVHQIYMIVLIILTMNNRVRFIQDHVAGQHSYIVRLSIMTNYFQRPRDKQL